MSLCPRILIAATLGVVSLACQSGRYSSAGFHLPGDGNPERGKTAFVALGCSSCHEVAGVDLPRSTPAPAVTVALGGEVDRKPSDAYLVTAMIDPSYDFALYPRKQIATDGHSHMPSYADRVSARQLVDIVSFLQSRYSLRSWSTRYVYPGMPG